MLLFCAVTCVKSEKIYNFAEGGITNVWPDDKYSVRNISQRNSIHSTSNDLQKSIVASVHGKLYSARENLADSDPVIKP